MRTHKIFEVKPQLARVGVPGEGHGARPGLVVRVWVVGAHQVRAVGGGGAAARDLLWERNRGLTKDMINELIRMYTYAYVHM